MNIGIYKITSPSGKIYIGQSWNIQNRFKKYKNCNPEQIHLFRSFNKYGYNNHTFEVVHILPFDISQIILDRYEQFYMDLYKESGFSLLNTRDAGRGGKHSIETKTLISLSLLGKPKSIEHRINTGIGKRGIYLKSAKKVIDKVTGKKYNSTRIASEQLGINYNTLKTYLSSSKVNKTNLEYEDRYSVNSN